MAFIFLYGVILYSVLLHTKRIRGFKLKDYVSHILVWYIFCSAPIAIVMQSTFFGYIVFSCVFTLLGFRMMFLGLGYALGWDEEKVMESSAMSAFFLIAVYIPLRLYLPEDDQKYIQPFSSAVTILGGNILLLAHLIMSSW